MTKKILTKKQRLILRLLYIFRFLNSKQIQEFLGHKDHRRINSWLKDLTDKEYIVRDFKPVYGTLTKPATFYLSALGRKSVKSPYRYYFPIYLRRIARDNKASKAFRIKCQIIADWYLMLVPPAKVISRTEKTEDKKLNKQSGIALVDYIRTILKYDVPEEETIPINTLQFFTPAYFPDFILLEKIKPDAYLRRRTTKGIVQGLLFVLDAYIPRLLLRYLVQRIFTGLDEENWEDDAIASLHLYVLCPNNQIIIYFKRLLPSFLERYYGDKPLQFHFATRNQLYKKKNGDPENIKWITFSSTDY